MTDSVIEKHFEIEAQSSSSFDDILIGAISALPTGVQLVVSYESTCIIILKTIKED